MKSLDSSDSLLPLDSPDFHTVFEEEEQLVDAEEDDLFSYGSAQKKRRLRADQVRALEKNFEVENKLEPERKVRLAQELGLQPRQVAVWFQNRRARWKTKQLEHDFSALKSRYDALQLDYVSLLRNKESLLTEVKDLKAKLGGDEDSESEKKTVEAETLTLIYNKDGSSDSDSSAVVNDENSPVVDFNGGGGFLYQPQLMKVEDGFLNGDEPCSFFGDEQQPALSWYCGGGWE